MAKETKITAETSKEELPSNVDTLKSMVLTLLEQIDDLTGQLHYLKRQLFGKKSEKLDPAQRLLFEDMYEEVKAKVEQQREEKAEPVRKTGRKKKHNGRNPLPAELPRETIEIEPSEEEKICPVCNTPKEVIGFETTEVLEYIPASFYVKQYNRKKFCCKVCESEISIGLLPPRAIDKGIAGEGLLAHIITVLPVNE